MIIMSFIYQRLSFPNFYLLILIIFYLLIYLLILIIFYLILINLLNLITLAKWLLNIL